MGWVRIDDGFYDHRKHLEAGFAGIGLWVTVLAWSNRNLTDGFIPSIQIARLGDEARNLTKTLVELGLLDEEPDGYRIHDYLEYQPLAEAVRIRRRTDRERKQSARTPDGIQAESSPSQPQPQLTDETLAERLSTGCGFPLGNCKRVVRKLRNENIPRLTIDEAIGSALAAQPDHAGYVLKVARDRHQQKTGGL